MIASACYIFMTRASKLLKLFGAARGKDHESSGRTALRIRATGF
jgi:hypothetical protein